MVYSAQSEKKMNELIKIVGEPIDSLDDITLQEEAGADTTPEVDPGAETTPEVDPEADISSLADPGVVGEGYSAFWFPDDAAFQADPNFLEAAEGPYGMDVMEYSYTRAGEPDTIYTVAVDVSDPEGATYGLVVQAVETTTTGAGTANETQDVTVYDSEGTVIDEFGDLTLDDAIVELTEEDLFGDPETDIAHLVSLLPEGTNVTEADGSGNVSYIVYDNPDGSGQKMLFATRSINSATGNPHYEKGTVWINSEVAGSVKGAVELFQESETAYALAKVDLPESQTILPEFISFAQIAGMAGLLLSGAGGGGGGDGGGYDRPKAASVRLLGMQALAAAGNIAVSNIDFSSLFGARSTAEDIMAGVYDSSKGPYTQIPESQDPLTVAMMPRSVPASSRGVSETVPELALAIDNLSQTGAARQAGADLAGDGFGELAIPDEVRDAVLSMMASNAGLVDPRRGNVVYPLNEDPDFLAAVEAMGNEVLAGTGRYPDGSQVVISRDVGLHAVEWVGDGGALNWHVDQSPRRMPGFTFVYTLQGSTTEYISNEDRNENFHFDQEEFDRSGTYIWYPNEGVAEEEFVQTMDPGSMSVIEHQSPNAEQNLNALLHRSPNEFDRSILIFTMRIETPRS
ncbi:MAG: hypothetical protein ABJO27_18040, partial [Pseudoruegeria sp.]